MRLSDLPNGGDLKKVEPKIGSLRILDTSSSSMTMEFLANITNPTNYSATVPYVNINVSNNGTVLAQAIASNLEFAPGPNDNIPIEVQWDPSRFGGEEGAHNARELISRYLSSMRQLLYYFLGNS